MSKSKSRKYVRCYLCKKDGYYRNECLIKKDKKFEKPNSNTDSKSNLV